ncbi:MAG: Mu transposase domain-containing protein [Acidimicrobiia bacterium]
MPEVPFTAAIGETRSVGFTSTVAFGGVRYSVAHRLVGEHVWIRRPRAEVVIAYVDPQAGPMEVARHPLSTPALRRIPAPAPPPLRAAPARPPGRKCRGGRVPGSD